MVHHQRQIMNNKGERVNWIWEWTDFKITFERQQSCAPLGPCHCLRSLSQNCGNSRFEEPFIEGLVVHPLWLRAEHQVTQTLSETTWNNFLTIWHHKKITEEKNIRFLWMIPVRVCDSLGCLCGSWRNSMYYICWCEYYFLMWITQKQKPYRQTMRHATRDDNFHITISFPNRDKRNATKCFCCDCLSTAEAIRHPAGKQGGKWSILKQKSVGEREEKAQSRIDSTWPFGD